jgi:hypothetical protein
MNSPFLQEQARRLASAVLREHGSGSGDQNAEAVRGLYRRALGRLPENDELALATAFIAGQNGGAKSASSTGNGSGLTPWEQLSQVLLLTNEFMFVD